MVIDHIGFGVTDLETSKEFYTKCLAPLGIRPLLEEDGNVGYGRDIVAPFWFGKNSDPSKKIHIAFRAENRAQVDAFYKAALEAGGIDNGAPGIREIYHPTYYAAFVLDPDGHNIEAVCHDPE